MYDVFISYRRKTGSFAAAVLEEFLEKEVGYQDVFFDAKSLREGPFDQHIDEAIDSSLYLLLVLNAGDLDHCVSNPEDDWILHEVGRAFERGKIVIPLIFGEGFVFPAAPAGSVLEKLSLQQSIKVEGAGGLDVMKTKLPSFMRQHPAKVLAKEYADGIVTKEFLAWEIATLKGIYGDVFPFIHELGQDSPTFTLPGSPEIVFPFDGLSENGILDPLEDCLPFEKGAFYQDFRKINGPNIHFPDLYGYTNKGFLYDEHQRIKGIHVQPRTYKESVYTCHILQYELFRLYQSLPAGEKNALPLERFPLRSQIHTSSDCKDVILNGKNRSALHDVIIAVILPNARTREYDIVGTYRTNDVATYPGYYDFIPAGGFELYELEKRQNWMTVKENFSVIGALYREFSEELFDDESFGKPTGNSDYERLFKCPEVRELQSLIETKKAQFVFLGVDFDLVTLRQTLCFALRVDDPAYFYKTLQANSESQGIILDHLRDFENKYNGRLEIVPETIGTWHLLKQHRIYQEIVENNYHLLPL